MPEFLRIRSASLSMVVLVLLQSVISIITLTGIAGSAIKILAGAH